MDNIETKGLGISELLDKIMQEEENKSKKKKNDSNKKSSNHLEPNVSVRSNIEKYSYNSKDINPVSNVSSGSNIVSQHLMSPNLPGVVPQINSSFPRGIPVMPTNGNINPFQNYNPPMQPIQSIECYGKHCAAVFEPPTPIQNFPLTQHYSDSNTNTSFSAPPKPGNSCSNSNNKEGKGKRKKKKKKTSNQTVTFTPTLKPPPSPPTFLKLSHDSQRTTSPRPYTPPLRPYTPLEPPPFISQEISFKQDQLQPVPSYTNYYPRTPPLNSHNSIIASIPSRPPEPLEPPPPSPERDYSEDLRTTLNALRERKRKRSCDENIGDSWRSNSLEVNETLCHQNNNNNNSNSRKENNFGRQKSSEGHNKFNNKDHHFAPLGVRFPGQNEIPPATIMDRISSFNSFPEPSPSFNANLVPNFPVMDGMPFPPPGVVFNNSVNIGPGPGPGPNPPFMEASGSFNSMESLPSPLNSNENPPYNLVEKQSLSKVFNEFVSNEYEIHEKRPHARTSSHDKPCKSRNNKKSTKKKKSHNYSNKHKNSHHRVKKKSSKTKHIKLSKHEKEKLRKKMKKYPDYELEPGECLSDSDLDLESISEESKSETSSTSSSSYTSSSSSSSASFSSSSDTEDSLYKLEFLKKRKPRISRYDKLCDKVSDEESKINSDNEEKPKFPRYFKDKVAYANEISTTPQEEQVILPEEVPPIVESSLISKEVDTRPPSPPISSESLKALKTPLIKRLGLAENSQETHEHHESSDAENIENKKEENYEYSSYINMSHTESSTSKSANPGSPLFSFEEYRQRSNSLSPNNSLDFEEYKLLVSTKEILSASKSIFKSPTSPKATTAKKYEKPIIKVETVSKPSPYSSKPSPYISSISESPQRIDLDSRIKLMFGMKSCGEDNSPEKKNFRNAAFSCKNMRFLSRPPSPFRSKNAYKYWHRETYYFRKNNPIPDVFFDPTQKTRMISDHLQNTRVGSQLSEFLEDTIRFSNIKPDYYQSVETVNCPKDQEKTSINSVEAVLDQNSEETKQKVKETAISDVEKAQQNTLEVEEALVLSTDTVIREASYGTSEADYNYENKVTTTKQTFEETEETIVSSSSNKNILKLRDSVMKVDVQSDTEVELVSKELEDKPTKEICDNQQKATGTYPSMDSGYMVQLILSKIVDELKNEIRERLIAEHLADENLRLDNTRRDQSDSLDTVVQRQMKEDYHEPKMDQSGSKSLSCVDQLQSNVINESGQS